MKMIFILLISNFSLAETIYTCTEEAATSIGWNVNTSPKKGIEPSIDKPKNKGKIVLVRKAKGAILKGNGGQVELKELSPTSFIETTDNGNIYLWNLYTSNERPTYVIQNKSYDLMGPFTTTVAYKCE